MTDFIAWMDGFPDPLVYIALSLGAALENVVPALPADTFVALGGFLAGAGDLEARWVVLGTWACNVAGAVIVYSLSHRHGPAFFERGVGRHLLRRHQLERVARFYGRWGTPAIFLSRFLPGVRAIVPVFAGTTHQPWPRVVLPLATASAIWYGGLVQLGVFAGHNLNRLASLLTGLNTTLTLLAAVVGLAAVLWWIRTRRHPDE